jgi:hypothetical protein
MLLEFDLVKHAFPKVLVTNLINVIISTNQNGCLIIRKQGDHLATDQFYYSQSGLNHADIRKEKMYCDKTKKKGTLFKGKDGSFSRFQVEKFQIEFIGLVPFVQRNNIWRSGGHK